MNPHPTFVSGEIPKAIPKQAGAKGDTLPSQFLLGVVNMESTIPLISSEDARTLPTH
jgi:hypothetical protein